MTRYILLAICMCCFICASCENTSQSLPKSEVKNVEENLQSRLKKVQELKVGLQQKEQNLQGGKNTINGQFNEAKNTIDTERQKYNVIEFDKAMSNKIIAGKLQIMQKTGAYMGVIQHQQELIASLKIELNHIEDNLNVDIAMKNSLGDDAEFNALKKKIDIVISEVSPYAEELVIPIDQKNLMSLEKIWYENFKKPEETRLEQERIAEQLKQQALLEKDERENGWKKLPKIPMIFSFNVESADKQYSAQLNYDGSMLAAQYDDKIIIVNLGNKKYSEMNKDSGYVWLEWSPHQNFFAFLDFNRVLKIINADTLEIVFVNYEIKGYGANRLEWRGQYLMLNNCERNTIIYDTTVNSIVFKERTDYSYFNGNDGIVYQLLDEIIFYNLTNKSITKKIKQCDETKNSTATQAWHNIDKSKIDPVLHVKCKFSANSYSGYDYFFWDATYKTLYSIVNVRDDIEKSNYSLLRIFDVENNKELSIVRFGSLFSVWPIDQNRLFVHGNEKKDGNVKLFIYNRLLKNFVDIAASPNNSPRPKDYFIRNEKYYFFNQEEMMKIDDNGNEIKTQVTFLYENFKGNKVAYLDNFKDDVRCNINFDPELNKRLVAGFCSDNVIRVWNYSSIIK